MQPVSTDAKRYDPTTMFFHWATAVLVVTQWLGAQTIDWFPRGPLRVDARSVHITVGVTLAALLAARVLWRATGGRRLPLADHGALNLVAKGTPAVRVVYQDGGQNPVFRPPANTSAFASLGGTETVLPYDAKEYGRHNLGDVSRPETLAAGPQEIEIGPKAQPTLMATAEPALPDVPDGSVPGLDLRLEFRRDPKHLTFREVGSAHD